MRNKVKNKMIIIAILSIFIISIASNVFAATDQAGLFCTGDLTNSYGSLTLSLARDGMSKLGYNIVQYNDCVTSKSTIMNYINMSGSNYGLYLKSHGSPTDLAVINGQFDTYINVSEVSGNWHFVFLDGCSTAADSRWADAFHTTGYSGRGFLGWYQTVWTDDVYEFSKSFWNQVGSKSLRDAALAAASTVPGSGTTPIRMYGDKSYYGWAW